MGNIQSKPKHNLYITKVTNENLPLVPFIHTILKYNNQDVNDTDPRALKEILQVQDLHLEVLDILQNTKFEIIVSKFTKPDEKLGISVSKMEITPSIMRIRVTAVKESSDSPLRIGDYILGIENLFVENEDELLFRLKSEHSSRVVVLREGRVVIVEMPGHETGCEIGIGLIYSVPVKEYLMESYNGSIKKQMNQHNISKAEDVQASSKENSHAAEPQEHVNSNTENQKVSKKENSHTAESQEHVNSNKELYSCKQHSSIGCLVCSKSDLQAKSTENETCKSARDDIITVDSVGKSTDSGENQLNKVDSHNPEIDIQALTDEGKHVWVPEASKCEIVALQDKEECSVTQVQSLVSDEKSIDINLVFPAEENLEKLIEARHEAKAFDMKDMEKELNLQDSNTHGSGEDLAGKKDMKQEKLDIQEELGKKDVEENEPEKKEVLFGLPQIPNKQPGAFNLIKNNRTDSYVYKSPGRPAQESVSRETETIKGIQENNDERIYREAEVPSERMYFQGKSTLQDEGVVISNTDLFTSKDVVKNSDGEVRMKDSIFKDMKDAQVMRDIFKDCTDSPNFENSKEI